MSNRNDITGDRLISRTLSKQGQDNWDLIFKKKKETNEDIATGHRDSAEPGPCMGPVESERRD